MRSTRPTGGEASDQRRALSEMIRDQSPDNGLVVKRVTRTAARRAEDLLGRLLRGEADGVGEAVTSSDPPGPGPRFYFMYDVSGYDGDDGYGP